MGFNINKEQVSGIQIGFWEKTNFLTDLASQKLIVEMSGWLDEAKFLSGGLQTRITVMHLVITGNLFLALAMELNKLPHPDKPVLEIIDDFVLMTPEFSGAIKTQTSILNMGGN